jgi:hypothetical protein
MYGCLDIKYLSYFMSDRTKQYFEKNPTDVTRKQQAIQELEVRPQNRMQTFKDISIILSLKKTKSPPLRKAFKSIW